MDYRNYKFDFERLDVYQKALDFTNDIFSLTLNFQREIQYSLGDQFRRAALSICNNIAEGSRKTARGRKQFYDYALDSARECVPMISLSVKQRQLAVTQEEALRDRCMHICNMLYKLGQSINN